MGFSIDRNIRRLRKEAGLTQEELAQKLFVTRQTISLWELGKVHPDLETLQKLAEQFRWTCFKCCTDRNIHRPSSFSAVCRSGPD